MDHPPPGAVKSTEIPLVLVHVGRKEKKKKTTQHNTTHENKNQEHS